MKHSEYESCPVGVLDSGLGGLSILKALRAALPAEDFIYCADCGNAPWGDRSNAFIIDRCRRIVTWLIARGAKAVVLACNTATAAAADTLRNEFSLPIIGIEPAVKPAARLSVTRTIGVLATTRTIQSERYAKLVKRFADDCHIISIAAPGLMECVERGDFQSPKTLDLLRQYLTPMVNAKADTLVLGCTHYPFLTSAILSIAPSMQVIEPGAAVAAVLRDRLQQRDALHKTEHQGTEYFYIKDCPQHELVLRHLWTHCLIKPEELAA